MARSCEESILEHKRKATQRRPIWPTTHGRGWKAAAPLHDPEPAICRALCRSAKARSTATTTISPACSNGRPAATTSRSESANEAAAIHSAETARAAGDGLRPAQFGLGVGQCRLRQDPCAGAARHPAAAGGHRPVQDPVPDLYARRGRQYGEPRLRQPCRMDDARRRRAGGARSTGSRAAARPRQAARGRGGCSPGAGDAGRPEDPDHPRLLRVGAAPVSAGGQHRRRISRCSTRRWRQRCSARRAAT